MNVTCRRKAKSGLSDRVIEHSAPSREKGFPWFVQWACRLLEQMEMLPDTATDQKSVLSKKISNGRKRNSA